MFYLSVEEVVQRLLGKQKRRVRGWEDSFSSLRIFHIGTGCNISRLALQALTYESKEAAHSETFIHINHGNWF